MNTDTGEIRPIEEVPLFSAANAGWKEMKLPPTEHQRKTGKVGRNESCPCGSGLKFKKCCSGKN